MNIFQKIKAFFVLKPLVEDIIKEAKMDDKDPWYRRTELWTAVIAFLQAPILNEIPNVGPYLKMASAVLAALGPLLYIHGRNTVKEAQATPVTDSNVSVVQTGAAK